MQPPNLVVGTHWHCSFFSWLCCFREISKINMVSYVHFTVFKKNYLLQCIHIPNNKASPSVKEIERAVLLPTSPKKDLTRSSAR